jgi:hypothetical protein
VWNALSVVVIEIKIDDRKTALAVHAHLAAARIRELASGRAHDGCQVASEVHRVA